MPDLHVMTTLVGSTQTLHDALSMSSITWDFKTKGNFARPYVYHINDYLVNRINLSSWFFVNKHLLIHYFALPPPPTPHAHFCTRAHRVTFG